MREMQIRRKRLAFSVRDLKGSLSHSETSYAVTTTRSDAFESGNEICLAPQMTVQKRVGSV